MIYLAFEDYKNVKANNKSRDVNAPDKPAVSMKILLRSGKAKTYVAGHVGRFEV